MHFFKYFNRLLPLASILLFVLSLLLLTQNISKGFDISDEGYYILVAQAPHQVFSVVSQTRYFTHALFALVGHDLAYFRLIGIVLLTLFSTWFAFELYRYTIKKLNYKECFKDKILFIIPIALAGLVYYRSWLITPSYNWLAFNSTLLVFIALFRIIIRKDINYSKWVSADYILLSISLSVSFLAKPTTALALTLVSLLFLIYEHKNIHIKKALPSVAILTSTSLATFLLVFHGSLETYYNLLIESVARTSLLDPAHTLSYAIYAPIKLLISFLSYALFAGIIFYWSHDKPFVKKFYKNIHFYLKTQNTTLKVCAGILIFYALILFVYKFDSNVKLIWLRGIELFFFSIFLFYTCPLVTKDTRLHFHKQFLKILPFLIILVLGSMAPKLGTNNSFIYAISNSTIFIVAIIVIASFIFDRTAINKSFFTPLSGLIMSVFVYYTLYYASQHPYRLLSGVTQQTQYIKLLGGLYVDEINKNYIQNLQNLAARHTYKNERITLIDMTGGSPGANVILKADFIDKPWLTGGYPGSEELAQKVLQPYINTNKLRHAWILTAPNGKIHIDTKVLNDLNLNFPYGYQKIGTVKAAYRNEIQELWKPK